MSTYVDQTSGSVAHCEAMAGTFPELAGPYYEKMASYCQQKLWHQLTLVVLEFVNAPQTTLKATPSLPNHKNTFVALYQEIVMVFSTKLNGLALAQIACAVAFASLQEGSTYEESKALLENCLKEEGEDKSNAGVATTLYLESKLGLLELQHSSAASDTSDASKTKQSLSSIYSTIKKNGPLLNQLIPDTPEAIVVNSSHYEMSMTYYKLVGPPEAYYDEAIHYLNYYQPTDENKAQSHALAVDLSLAALTGEGVYNLGQVVVNPILQVLQGTSDGWLVELLQACVNGQVTAFKTLCQQTYPTQIASQPALVNMATQMQEKMTLLALAEMAFEKPASERTLDFAEIASRLEIPLDQVEWVIMRAFSVKLMEGTMDQVDGTVHVTWVLPRTLAKDQMSDLARRFGEWAAKVSKTQEYMQEHATLAS